MLVGSLVGDRLLLSDIGPYGIFMNVRVVIIVAMVILLRDFWPYRIILMTVCLPI